jgi:hopanoid biosynthesis associated protein HpnK
VKRLVVTADDFGLCPEVNEAVGRAYRDGILTCASLMMGGDAVEGAVGQARAGGMPVGLHLTLVEGRPVLPPHRVPDLVDARGRFRAGLVGPAVRLAASRRVRQQVAAECRAQVEAFLATGLTLDHINAHHHYHLHPFVLDLVIDLARRHGGRAVRTPLQPGPPPPGQALMAAVMRPWAARARARLRAAGIPTNDALFGLHETGRMTRDAWLAIVPRLPDGLSEVYCHPATATRGILRETMAEYRHAEELDALLSPDVRAALDAAGIRRVPFSVAARPG